MPAKAMPISNAVRTKLKNARIARLATLDAEGRPHLVPICFVYDAKAFYSAIDLKPKRVAPKKLARLKNIRRSPQVSLLIDEYAEDWTQLWYILVRGAARLLPKSARDERARAIRKLKAKYPQYSAGMLADDAPVIRITVERITTWGNL